MLHGPAPGPQFCTKFGWQFPEFTLQNSLGPQSSSLSQSSSAGTQESVASSHSSKNSSHGGVPARQLVFTQRSTPSQKKMFWQSASVAQEIGGIVGVGVGEGLPEGVGEGLPLGDAVGEAVGEAVGLGVRVRPGVGVGPPPGPPPPGNDNPHPGSATPTEIITAATKPAATSTLRIQPIEIAPLDRRVNGGL
jgi:hypothetical protein